MLNYVFGGNTDISSPEELVQRRRAAEALMRSGSEETPHSIGQGITAIARALSGRWGYDRLAEEEAQARQGAEAKFGALFNGAAAPPSATPTWTSLPDGIEQGAPGPQFASASRENIAASGGGNIQPTGNAGAEVAHAGNDIGALLKAYSDPWMSAPQRDVLKLYIQRRLNAAGPKTQVEPKAKHEPTALP